MAVTPYLHAFGIGAVAGSRSLAPAAMLIGGSSRWSRGAKLLAAGELIGDKLPMTPSRLSRPALSIRALSGVCSGGAVASARDANRLLGMACGLSGALLGAWLGFTLRANLVTKRNLPDLSVALAEDALALGLAYLVTRPAKL